MKPQFRLILITFLLLLSLASIASAQEEVVYIFTGSELQRIENGEVVQVWSMSNTLEAQHIRAILEASERYGSMTPAYRFSFAQDRMYVLREGQVAGLWLLHGNRWVEEPVLNVQYMRRGGELRRVVNGEVQQVWNMLGGLEAQQIMTGLQAEANKQVALHVFTELYSEHLSEHIPQLVSEDFKLHYIPVDKRADWSWYRLELEAVLANPAADPVIIAVDDLVVTQHPVDMNLAGVLNIPPLEADADAVLFDIYRIRDGKVTDLWMGYDLNALLTR